MKRRILPLFMVICMIMTMLPATALAAEGENVAAIGDTEYATLQEAIDASNGETITLLADIADSSRIALANGQKVTIDLAGYNIGFSSGNYFEIVHGELNLTGSGTVYEQNPYYGAVMLYGGPSGSENYSVLNVGADVTLEGWSPVFIDYNSTTVGNDYGIVVNVNGTLVSKPDSDNYLGSAVYVNGTIKVTEGTVPQITLDGADLSAPDGGNGMYLAGYTNTTILDTTITGDTGIEIRAGKLTIDNSTITGTSIPTTVTPNGNGSTTDGAGIALAQHTTKLPIDVEIISGTVSGFSALYQSNPEENEDEYVEQVTLKVTGGTFIATNGGTVAVYSENKTGFISGGTVSGTVSADYLADGVDLIANSDGTYSVGAVTAENAAAQVGDNYYGTLEEAIAAATDGQTVQVLKDLTISEKQTISTGITLDLGGHTLTIAGPDDDDSIYVAPGEDAEAAINVTIQNGTITDMRGQGKTALGRNTVFAQGLVNLTTRDLTVEAYAPADQASPYYNYLLRISPAV